MTGRGRTSPRAPAAETPLIGLTLAVEDALSEAVLRQMVRQSGRPFVVHRVLRRGGFGFLRANIGRFYESARGGVPYIVLTDQDRVPPCPAEKKLEWLEAPPHENFLFRIAVMEVESWVLAHREAVADFLGISVRRIPLETDLLGDPKRFLMDLVRGSTSRHLRRDLLPGRHGSRRVGPNYNHRLEQFVRQRWRVKRALRHSESLRRAFARLRAFSPELPA